MSIVRSLALAVALFTSAAHAQTQPWTTLPFDGFGIEPAERARMAALPVFPDVLEPLWDRASQLTLFTTTFGPPDSVDGFASNWEFNTLRVSVFEMSSLTLVEIAPRPKPDPAFTRHFDSRGLAFAPLLDAVTGHCGEALALLGQPSFKEKRVLAWTSASKSRDVGILLDCVGDDSDAGRVQTLRFIQCEASPKDVAAMLATSTTPARLPARFKQVAAAPRALDPRELWPRGFVPGDSVANVFQKVGVPSLLDMNSGVQMRWAFALAATVADGTLRQVTLPAQGLHAYARLGVTSPLLSALGQPIEALVERLGPAIVRASYYTWRWTAQGHELAISGQVEHGTLSQLVFTWVPPPRREALACAALLEQKPTRAPPPVAFTSGDVTLTTAQLVPFKLWFGANHSDVVKRLGLPIECDEGGDLLQFQGVEAHFYEGRLDSLTVQVEFLPAELYTGKDPLLGALAKGAVATLMHLGEAPDATAQGGALTGTFEHRGERIELEIGMGPVDVPGPVTVASYRVWSRQAFDFGLVTGLRLDRLPTRAALGLVPLDGVQLHDSVLVLRTADKPGLKAKKVGGKLIDLLGASWSTVTAALGETSDVAVSDDKIYLLWAPSDPLERRVTFVCVGVKPTCDELHLSGRSP